MLARVDAAVAQHELEDLLRDRAHRLDLGRLAQVDERPDVQAADRAVAVEARAQAVPVEHLARTRRRRPARFSGGTAVSSTKASGRLEPGARRHQQPEAGLAHLQQRRAVGGLDGAQRVVAVAVALPVAGQRLDRGARLGLAVGEERDEHERRGLALEDLVEPGVVQRSRDSRRIVSSISSTAAASWRHRVGGRVDRLARRAEMADGDRLRGGPLDQVDLGLGDQQQRALGADDELRQVEAVHESGRAGSRRRGARSAGGRARSLRGSARRSRVGRGRSPPRATLARAPRPARSGRGSRPRGRRPAPARGRSSSRSAPSGCRPSCCRSSRRASRGSRSTCRRRTSARARPAARLRSSCTTPGCTRARRPSASSSTIRCMWRDVSSDHRAPDRLAGEAGAGPAREDRDAELARRRHDGGDVVGVCAGTSTASGSIAYMLASLANRWRV